jgi:PIN domain nuclease of toxin-antitoxin system
VNLNYLVDTQILLWTITKSSRLSLKLISLLKNDFGVNSFYFSQISLFEMAIKHKIGKLPEITGDILTIYRQLIDDGYNFLPISNQHIHTYNMIPFYDNHRDPFDRLLLATAMVEKMTIISSDDKFKQYTIIIDIFEV